MMQFMKQSMHPINFWRHGILFSILCLGIYTLPMAYSQDYNKIHQNMIVVDGHNDVIYEAILKGKDIGQELNMGHTDIPRLKKGGVNVQVFAVWSDDKKWPVGKAFAHANEQLDALENTIDRNSDEISLATSTKDIEKILNDGKIAAVIGVEGGNMIEGSLEYLEQLYNRGARYLTLTWNYNLPWVTAAAVETDGSKKTGKGLSVHGRDIIRKMNELGMMVDLSHGSKQSFYDVLEVTSKPILVSHSNAYALTPHYRNLDDKQLEALKENGGVVGVNFYSGFLDSDFSKRVMQLYEKQEGSNVNKKLIESRNTGAMYAKLSKELRHEADTPIESLMRHIDYLVDKVGIDHVAVGSDYDGIESTPQGLEDVSKFPNLTKALLERGYSEKDVAKIMGLNFLRVWNENEND